MHEHQFESTNPNQLEVSMPPEERVFPMESSPDRLTYILDVTEPLEAALERVGVELKGLVTVPDGSGGEQAFLRKREFHLTCIGFGHMSKMEAAAASYEGGREAFAAKVAAILSSVDFSFKVDTSNIRLIKNLEYDAEAVKAKTSFESKGTIAVDVVTTGIKDFYRRLNDELGIDLGSSAAHATLYIESSDAMGLGIAVTDLRKQLEGPSDAGPHITSTPLELNDISR